jgi:hypothetical protein
VTGFTQNITVIFTDLVGSNWRATPPAPDSTDVARRRHSAVPLPGHDDESRAHIRLARG